MAQRNEYPYTIDYDGQELILRRETRWTRVFASQDGKLQLRRSRFQDDSATIGLKQLTTEWQHWSMGERKDFCDSAAWLPRNDREGILRFLMKQADHRLLHNLALSMVYHLGQAEVLPWLLKCIDESASRESMGYLQALAYTRAPEAAHVIRDRLNRAWTHPEMFQPDLRTNDVAMEAAYCIVHLIELGCSTPEDIGRANRLADHPWQQVRELYKSHLAKYCLPNSV
jgi:hypothetical protein